MLKDGTLPPGMVFEDDNIRRYDPRLDPKRAEKGAAASRDARDYPATSASHSWQEASDKFSKEARELKKQANQPRQTASKRKAGKTQNLNSSHTNLNATHEAGGYSTHPLQQTMGTTADPYALDGLGTRTGTAYALHTF
jgi:hypothetical protein